nr:hypothetical protein [Deltaproteobacteria bacterium]
MFRINSLSAWRPWRSWRLTLRFCAALLAVTSCGEEPEAVIDLASALDENLEGAITSRVDGDVTIQVGDRPLVLEAWIDGEWIAPHTASGDIDLAVGPGTLTVWARGTPPPPAQRERAIAWFDPALLDDPTTISFARVMAAISDDGHGGALLDRWFRSFASGPGAGRATFAQFLGEVAAMHGSDPGAWDLAVLPFRVTGVHNRADLARGEDCGELR